MFPYFSVLGIEFHSNSVLTVISMIACLILFLIHLRKDLGWFKGPVLVLTVSINAFLGARLFHVFFERWDHFKNHPELIFSQFDGMTFYGSFFAGALTIWILLRFFKLKKEAEAKVWDLAGIGMVLTYSLMRFGCFANGCCWGRITPMPWSVQYFDPRSVMPYQGIPVHPVQLYDSGFGILLFGLTYFFFLKGRLRGFLCLIVCLAYPVGRFITEIYRGDAFRGIDLLFGLSTSQLISLVLFFAAAILLWRKGMKAKN